MQDIRRRIEAELPSYEALAGSVVDQHVRLSLLRTLDSAQAGHPAMADHDLTEVAEVGAVQAQAGIPVDDMLRVWRMGIELVLARARTLAAELRIADDQVLEFVALLLAWSDAAMIASASAHRAAEIEMARSDHERRAAFVRGVLLGAIAPATLRIDAEAYGLDATAQYVPIRAHAADPTSQLELERALGLTAPGPPRRGIGTLLDGDVCGFVRARPRTRRWTIGAGPPAPLDRLAESFGLATRALTTATAFGVTGVVDLAALGVRAAVVADRDVTEQLTRRYLEPLSAAGSRDGHHRHPARLPRLRAADRRRRRAADRPPEHRALPPRPLRGTHRREPARHHRHLRTVVGAGRRTRRYAPVTLRHHPSVDARTTRLAVGS